jgi:hypothetical protein
MDQENNTGVSEMEAAAPVETDGSESNEAGNAEKRQVPLEALQASRAEKQRLQDELKILKDHLALVQATQSRPSQQKQDDFDGLSEDDVLTVKDLKKALSQKEQQFHMTIEELRMTQKYPDYQIVVTKYLPEILKTNPRLADTLQKTQDYELAYYLATNSETYKADHKRAKKNADAERIVQNANRAGSLSSVGQTSPISQAKQYKSMSDDEFKKVVNKNLGYF